MKHALAELGGCAVRVQVKMRRLTDAAPRVYALHVGA